MPEAPSIVTDYQVIIAGAGPVGLTLANLLGCHGVRTLVLEKTLSPPDAPRAVSLDDESLRIWQQCGMIDDIMPFVAQGEEGDVVFTYRDRHGRAIFNMTQHGRPYGYARGNVFLFHRVLEVLQHGLERFDRVTLRRGWTVRQCRQSADGVTLEAVDSRGRVQKMTASYLVGCDGGRSVIRNGLQIPMQGAAYTESWLIADTWEPEMAGRSPREGVEVWCDQRCPTASIPLPDGFHRWEFLLRRNKDPNDYLDDASILDLISRHKPQQRTKVLRRLVHTYKGCIADHYGRGRIFLAGDAAHLSPPFAGQGMATGLRDAANLAWKLAHVLHGLAPVSLLESYEAERRPHQVRMLRLARRMGRMMMPHMHLQEVLVAGGLRLAGRLARIRQWMEVRGVNITPVYGQRSERSRAGQLLIQPKVGEKLLDDLLGLNETIITFDQSVEALMNCKELQVWQDRGTAFLCLRPDGKTEGAYLAFDQWLDGCYGRLLIVRPDRFVKEDRLLFKGRAAERGTHKPLTL